METVIIRNERDKANYSSKVIEGIRQVCINLNLDEEIYLRKMNEDFNSDLSLETLHTKYDKILVPYVERDIFEECFNSNRNKTNLF